MRDNNYIHTYTGKKFYFQDPKPEDFSLVDIAHALAQTPRFGGHCRFHYSVAQHCLAMADMLDTPEEKLYALLHDASEAYIGDLPRPIKRAMPAFKNAEDVIHAAIFEWAGLDPVLPDVIHYLDHHCVRNEAEHLFSPVPKWVEDFDRLPTYPGKYFVWKPHAYWENLYYTTAKHLFDEVQRGKTKKAKASAVQV